MTLDFFWLTACAFLLGACPFSLWLGALVLRKDIRRYGDGNPGAANVFRAGNPALGMLAVFLDIFKGVPAVYLADNALHLPESQLLFIGFAAIMGHAFSPLLLGRGGKAVAVTFGVLIGLTRPDMLIPFAAAALAAFLVLESHSWIVLVAPAAALTYAYLSHASGAVMLFLAGILLLFIFKNARETNGWPHLKPWLYRWLQSRRQV